MDMIFLSIGKEIWSDFNNLWKYFEEKAEKLKTPSTTLGHLKSNKELMDQTRAELPNLEKLIWPMQIKYDYLKDNQKDQSVQDLD